jgi:predicted ABC-type ATPase
MPARPRLFVLAGVNGTGKSTIGGDLLTQAGIGWFNPDTFTRQLVETTGSPLADANAAAWQEGLRRLEAAIASGGNYAFETTLGGNTITAKLREASATHDVLMWFCGLDSPEHHLARVRLRVSRGGHDIPEAKIRERCVSSIANLIALLPHLARLQVYDNSRDAEPGTPVPNPRLLLQLDHGRIVWPREVQTLRDMPDWAKPILEVALSGGV